MIVMIEVIQDGALNLLSDMERLNLIKVSAPAENTVIQQRKKPSEQFAGALHLSDSGYEAYQNTLREGRNEWNRNIY